MVTNDPSKLLEALRALHLLLANLESRKLLAGQTPRCREAHALLESFVAQQSLPHSKDGALTSQVGGDHYKTLAIQPVEYIHRNGLPFIEGSVVKYVTRWRTKNGIEDVKKARHFLDLLIEMEAGK